MHQGAAAHSLETSGIDYNNIIIARAIKKKEMYSNARYVYNIVLPRSVPTISYDKK